MSPLVFLDCISRGGANSLLTIHILLKSEASWLGSTEHFSQLCSSTFKVKAWMAWLALMICLFGTMALVGIIGEAMKDH
jgi:hypothetical protein